MEAQNQESKNKTITPQNQPKPPIETPIAKSRLSLVGLIFAVICPPVGLVISIIALYKIKRNHLGGSGRAIFGIICGAILTLPYLFFIWLFIALGGLHGNDAKKDAMPFIVLVQKAGGKELCENGDSGFSIDNTQPWYEVYYQIPDSSSLTSTIKSDAAQVGYPLITNTTLIKQLNSASNKFNNSIQPLGAETFNPKSDYLISEKNGSSLTVTINRDTSVPLACGVSNYDKRQATGNNDAILDINLTLPDRT